MSYERRKVRIGRVVSDKMDKDRHRGCGVAPTTTHLQEAGQAKDAVHGA